VQVPEPALLVPARAQQQGPGHPAAVQVLAQPAAQQVLGKCRPTRSGWCWRRHQ